MTAEKKTTQVAPIDTKENLPAHLQHGKKASLGNIDRSDFIMPRLKLLASVSSEVEEFEAAKAGEFWHSISAESLGKSVRFIPLVIRKSFVLWAPRSDSRGVLARANDAIHWDVADEFRVKLKGIPKDQVWSTKDKDGKPMTVAESGLGQFGSSVDGDQNSPPAASLTYNILAYLPDFPELSPVVILNARSSVKKAKMLISKIEMRPVDHYDQVYVMSSTSETKDGDTFYNYAYTADGYTNAAQHDITAALYERFKEADFKAADENDDDVPAEGKSGGGTVGGKAGKF